MPNDQLGQPPEQHRVHAAASTPSGGTHEFITSLGVGSRDDVRPGFDVKGGRPDGTSRGFAFIAPAGKRSKTTGAVEAYGWTTLPDPTTFTDRDDSGQGIAELVRQTCGARGTRSAPTAAADDAIDRTGGRPDIGPHVDGARHPGPRRDRSIPLTNFPPGPPCVAMLRQQDAVTKALANGGRHQATLGPVLQMVRLGQQGHKGLPQALADIEDDFVDRLARDRPGGHRAAEAEWNHSVQGALGIVLEAGCRLAPYACCRCLIAEFRRAVEGNTAFTPRGRGNERKVLRYLIDCAERGRSLRVTESQRQIAEASSHKDIYICAGQGLDERSTSSS